MIVCERKYGQLEESSRIFGMVVMIVIDIPGLVSLHTLHIFCLLQCLTAACKALSLANGKGKGTNGLEIGSLD